MGSRKESCQQLSVRKIALERGVVVVVGVEGGGRWLGAHVLQGAIASKPSK